MAAALDAAHWQAAAVHTPAQKMTFILSKLNFDPHDELTFVSLVEWVGRRQMSCGHRNEMKLKVVLWKVTNRRDTTFRKHQYSEGKLVTFPLIKGL